MTSVAQTDFSPRRSAARAASSPWSQIVRAESDGILSPPSPTTSSAIEQVLVSASAVSFPADDDFSDNGNAGAAKRPAWKKPSNGVAVAAEVGPVMGAESWPALSESTKAPAKSSSESMKSSDGSAVSVPVTQGTATASSSLSQRQANPQSIVPARQRSMKRNGGGNTSVNGGFSHPPAPASSLVDMPPTSNPPRDSAQKGGFGSHSHNAHNGNNHPQRNSFRSHNGVHPRGDGSHHYGGRREQDRGNQDWNAHRNFTGRDAHHIHQHRVVPRFIAPPPPPNLGPFMPPSSVRHFGSPIGFPELSSPVYFVATPPPESLRGGSIPFVSPIPPAGVFLHAPDFHLHGKIVTQIDYYFSNENLIKDTYLRQNMDDQGWVPIKLLAGFKRVKLLTENIQLISDAVRASTVVEVQGDKVRRRNDWMRWIMPPTVHFSNRTQPSGMSSHDMMATRVQGLNLEENASARGQADFNAEPLLGRSKSGEFNSQSSLSGTEGAGQGSVPGSDHSVPSRN